VLGKSLVSGSAHGTLLVCNTGLSFWGGVDPITGIIIDQHHPLRGECVSGKVLALPGGRGSCSGSGTLLELMLNNMEPAALVFTEAEEILTLGVVVAEQLFDRSIPVLLISRQSLEQLRSGIEVAVAGSQLRTLDQFGRANSESSSVDTNPLSGNQLSLSKSDQSMLAGDHGKAAQVAMQIVARMAEIQGAVKLIDVQQAHIDACVYHGSSSLQFARRLVEWGARVRIPTTLNSLSVDKQRWRCQGVSPDFGEPASQLGDAYVEMGAKPGFTCAPYLLDSAPSCGDQIVWAESNAVMYANSVLGARTQKYPDFLDICIALTGRAPATGCHLDSGRQPTIRVEVSAVVNADDSFWPLLGYHIGMHTAHKLPVIFGLEHSTPSTDDLKAFSAAFATTSSTPMFHMIGVTPEALSDDLQAVSADGAMKTVSVGLADLHSSWISLNTAIGNTIDEAAVDLICLGNPHFSLTECQRLASLCAGRVKSKSTGVMVTMGREVYQMAREKGCIQQLEDFGVQFVSDTCWCMLNEPVIPATARILMTNSGKYAHYGPGLVDRLFYFGSLPDCVDVACSGSQPDKAPDWLSGRSVSNS